MDGVPLACLLGCVHGQSGDARDMRPHTIMSQHRPRQEQKLRLPFGLAQQGPALAFTGTPSTHYCTSYMAPSESPCGLRVREAICTFPTVTTMEQSSRGLMPPIQI